MRSNDILDKTKQYQFLLERSWEDSLPDICWILLNPSLGPVENDQTLERCLNYSKRWGFGSLSIVNLFALRTTLIKDLLEKSEPVGKENDDYILAAVEKAQKIIVAWGGSGNYLNRNQRVLEKVKGKNLYCLKHLIDGNPAHPLFVPKHCDPILFDRSSLVKLKNIA